MSEEVYEAIARASCGFVESPAGCGKTEAIVRTVGTYCSDPQLILTHTHAGVDALRQRFRKHHVPTNRYHVDTIAGWAWGWVRKYPSNARYSGPADVPEWNSVYAGMSNLLVKDFVKQGVLNSYAGVIVDEYQDCTGPMHDLIVQLRGLLPCRVLGDDLQGIFDFRGDPLVGWADVQGAFANDLGGLGTPHRWINAGNENLGRWLLRERPAFRQDREPDYGGSSVDRSRVRYGDLRKEVLRLTGEKEGRICIIGPKARRLNSAVETMLVKRSYRVLEPNDLTALRDLLLALADGTPSEQVNAAIRFFSDTHGGLSPDTKTFIANLLKGEGGRPRRADRRAIFDAHRQGISPTLLADLLGHVTGLDGVSCKLRESVSALKCILEEHFSSGADLMSLYAEEISRRKYHSRSNVFRCIGSTLLVKGLEFDHAVILRDPNWQQNWGSHRDLYVALSRGSKSVSLIDLAA